MRTTGTLPHRRMAMPPAGLRRQALLAVFVLVLSLLTQAPRPAFALVAGDLYGPTGSGQFGLSVTVLPSGNMVVTDPGYDTASTQNVGAVYLYHGGTHALISTLTGSSANDAVGGGGVVVLTNGNYIVRSPSWSGNRGAVTWGDGTSGSSGSVSAQNSLVGSSAGELVGYSHRR